MNHSTLFLGLNTIDIQFLIHRYPQENTKTKALDNAVHIGGPATNAAITHAFLGGQSFLLTCIGKNEFSPFVKRNLDAFGVKYQDLTPEYTGSPTFASVLTSEEDGERTIFSYAPKHQACNHNLRDQIQFREFSSLLLDGFHPEVALQMARLAKNNGIPVILDAGSWKPQMECLLAAADIVICSADFHPPAVHESGDVFRYLHLRYGITKVAVSRGNKNIRFSENGRDIEEIPVHPVRAKDTLGAGDVLHGAFSYYYSIHADFESSLIRASEVASFSCRYFGSHDWINHWQ